MTRTSDWLAGYEKAWRSKDAADIKPLFTDDAEYWFRPDDPDPVRGIEAIIAMWQEDEPAEPQYDLSVLIENGQLGIVRGRVDYPGHESYENLWEVHFADDGRAQKFVEWFMTPRRPTPPGASD